MTYVVGVRYGTCAAVICDSRVTFDDATRTPLNVSLKSGSLFPGCVYGLSGEFEEARTFIIRAKDFLNGRSTLDEFWARFVAFVAAYKFVIESPKGFKLVLAIRHREGPAIFILDSKLGLIEQKSNVVSVGSGAGLLHDFVTKNVEQLNMTAEVNAIPEILPFTLCLLLMELVQGDEFGLFERAGVGGYFHFSYQTQTMDARQPPCVYVLCRLSPAEKRLLTWVYRIAFCDAALVIECPINNMRYIQLDTAAWPRAADLSEAKLNSLREAIDHQTALQPYYNLCGFGSASSEHRGHNPVAVTSEEKYVISRDGRMTPQFDLLAKAVFADYGEAMKGIKTLNSTPNLGLNNGRI